jgi:hypothetical protein
MPEPIPPRPLFDSAGLHPLRSQYVGWIDVMGTQVTMARSTDVAASFIFKLHISALESLSALKPRQRKKIKLYPIMDGIYFVASNELLLFKFMSHIFGALANEFVSTEEMERRFLVRGALACGPVVHGSQIPDGASNTLRDYPGYKSSILLGLPVIQAFLGERSAPPFSIFVHESARAFAPEDRPPIQLTWWRWFKTPNDGTWPGLATKLKQELCGYFEWCEKRSEEIGYKRERIKAHRELVDQYFADVLSPQV